MTAARPDPEVWFMLPPCVTCDADTMSLCDDNGAPVDGGLHPHRVAACTPDQLALARWMGAQPRPDRGRRRGRTRAPLTGRAARIGYRIGVVVGLTLVVLVAAVIVLGCVAVSAWLLRVIAG